MVRTEVIVKVSIIAVIICKSLLILSPFCFLCYVMLLFYLNRIKASDIIKIFIQTERLLIYTGSSVWRQERNARAVNAFRSLNIGLIRNNCAISINGTFPNNTVLPGLLLCFFCYKVIHRTHFKLLI